MESQPNFVDVEELRATRTADMAQLVNQVAEIIQSEENQCAAEKVSSALAHLIENDKYEVLVSENQRPFLDLLILLHSEA